MNPRAAVAPIVAAVVVLVAVVGGSSPAAQSDRAGRSVDLVASAHPSSARPTVSDVAFDVSKVRGWDVKADTAALTSTTCDGCAGHSSALHVLYLPRASTAALDNVANAWTQGCTDCTGTALSVQVVVLRGRPATIPNNRALALNAACTGCRTAALAFQVVLVADDAMPLTLSEVAELRAWVQQQAFLLNESVSPPLADPTASQTPTASPTPTTGETAKPSPVASPSPTLPTSEVRAVTHDRLRVRRDAVSALGELEDLLAHALDAETVSSDVELSR